MRIPRLSSIASIAALCFAAGCSSADSTAAAQAAHAQAALDQGNIAEARIAIRKVLAARDDIVDYWILKAHIDLRAADRPNAFADYQYVIQLDHGNMEALAALCQLGISVGAADEVDKYADQMLVIAPNAAMPLTAKGTAALMRGDRAKAQAYADRVLAREPQNLQALILQARLMIAANHYAEGAMLIEKAPDSAANVVPMLVFLKETYAKASDRPAYQSAVIRLAAAEPEDYQAQFDYADLLYQQGQNEQARAVIRKMMTTNPANTLVAATALNLWMRAGSQALDLGKVVAEAAPMSLLMKADYAQFATENGRPDLAIAILRGVDQGEPAYDNANAKAAYAYAIGVNGRMSEALGQLNAILDDDHDPNQPWALLARARLLAATHQFNDAVRDARLLVVNDPRNTTARLALADILRASGSPDLSESALREGLRAMPDSLALAERLVATLVARGDRAGASQIARDTYRFTAMDMRSQRLLQLQGDGPIRLSM